MLFVTGCSDTEGKFTETRVFAGSNSNWDVSIQFDYLEELVPKTSDIFLHKRTTTKIQRIHYLGSERIDRLDFNFYGPYNRNTCGGGYSPGEGEELNFKLQQTVGGIGSADINRVEADNIRFTSEGIIPGVDETVRLELVYNGKKETIDLKLK